MNISPLIPLTIGIVALVLFVILLGGAAWVSLRNRRKLKKLRKDNHI